MTEGAQLKYKLNEKKLFVECVLQITKIAILLFDSEAVLFVISESVILTNTAKFSM